jgi:beta-lactamase regulating signal transducer with metallopeptidase domain
MPENIESIPEAFVYTDIHSIDAGISAINKSVSNTDYNPQPIVNPADSVNIIDIIFQIASIIWAAGIIILLVYGLFSYIRLKNKLSVATLVNDNIFETDQIQTPFVMGIIKPKIFIPVNIPTEEFNYILKHEQTHIKRYDNLIKPLSFLALTIHWFNPFMWVSYFLMSKDMEMSCDESVMKSSSEDIRGKYSNSLLSLSVKQSGLLVPLAFGESNVKTRIKNVLNYKKTSFWILASMIIVVVIITVALGTNPINEQQYEFPLAAEDIENVLVEQGINMYIKDYNGDDLRSIANLSNDENMVSGINSQLRNNYKVLSMTWYLPKDLTSDEVYDFFQNEFPKQFELAGIFYGNKKGLDKQFNKMLSYYLDDKNYNNILDWNEKTGNDNIKIQIKPMLGSNRNNVITLLVIPDELYDDYLNSINNSKELTGLEAAKEFITEFYTVNSEEIAVLDLRTNDIMTLAEANESNDKIFEPLMTEMAYNIFVKSRQSFMYILYCAKNNYTMEVLNITLSQISNDTVDKVEYDFDVKVKFISNNENTAQTDTAKGYLSLIKENGEWKVSDYRETEFSKTIVN